MHPDPKFRLKRSVEDAYSIADFLHGTNTMLYTTSWVFPYATR
jgi:hypothetical protein